MTHEALKAAVEQTQDNYENAQYLHHGAHVAHTAGLVAAPIIGISGPVGWGLFGAKAALGTAATYATDYYRNAQKERYDAAVEALEAFETGTDVDVVTAHAAAPSPTADVSANREAASKA